MVNLLKLAVDSLTEKELPVAIANTKAEIQARGYKKTTDLHKALYLLVARQLKQELKLKRRK